MLSSCDEEEERRPPPLGMTTGTIPGAQGGTSSGGSASETSGSLSDDGTGGFTTNGSNGNGGTSGFTTTATSNSGGGTSGFTTADPTLTSSATLTTGGTTGFPSGGSGPGWRGRGEITWAVGARGELLHVDAKSFGSHDAGSVSDLHAIAGDGQATAWIVGEEGLALYTLDGGETWDRVTLPAAGTLRAIALAGTELVQLAGDDGQWFVSRDGGVRFSVLQTPRVPWTGLATDGLGLFTFATGSDGSLWRHDAEAHALERVFAGSAPLRAIAITEAGDRVIAVGDAGTWIESEDLGETWIARDVDTQRDLFAVRVSSQNDLALAVGEAGVVVRVESSEGSVDELPGDAVFRAGSAAEWALRAIDLSAEDRVIVVGDAGLAFTSHDTGRSWHPMGLANTQDLHGVVRLGSVERP